MNEKAPRERRRVSLEFQKWRAKLNQVLKGETSQGLGREEEEEVKELDLELGMEKEGGA